jgi:hypothetical protein
MECTLTVWHCMELGALFERGMLLGVDIFVDWHAGTITRFYEVQCIH